MPEKKKIRRGEVLEALQIGFWMLTLHPDIKECELEGDERTYRAFGLEKAADGKERFQKWREGIDHVYHKDVKDGIYKMISGEVTEIEYYWKGSRKESLAVCWLGVKVSEEKNQWILKGCHRTTDDIVFPSPNTYGQNMSKKMKYLIRNDFYQAMLSGTSGYMEVDLESGMIQNSGGVWEKYAEIGKERYIGFQEIGKKYIKEVVIKQDFDLYSRNMDLNRVKALYENGKQTWNFQFRRLAEDASYHWMEVVTYVFQENVTKHRYALFYIKDIDSNKKRHLEQEKAASMDPLTNVMNRRKFEASVALYAVESDVKGCSLLLFDIDHFKDINDSRGHQEGDAVLKKFAVILMEAFRKTDYIGRFGGDEFVVFTRHMPKKIIDQRLEKIRQIGKNMEPEGVTCSIGIYFIEENEMDYEQFLKRTDYAMYKGKERGRDQFCYWNDISDLDK